MNRYKLLIDMPFQGWYKGVVIYPVLEKQSYYTSEGAASSSLYLKDPRLFPQIFEPVIDDVKWLANWLDEQDSTYSAAEMIISNGFNISKFRQEVYK